MNKVSNWLLLTAGILATGISHAGFGIGFIAWFAPIPFLLYLRGNKGWKHGLLFFSAFFLSWSLAFLKIISTPLPVIFALLFALPVTLLQGCGYLIWRHFAEKKGALLLFPAIMILMEWIQHSATPFASWGAAAYTQLENPALLQTVSLFGIAGLGFLIYLVSAMLERVISGRSSKKEWTIVIAILGIFWTFGSLRLSIGERQARTTILTAAIGTDSTVGASSFPTTGKRQIVQKNLIKRTITAAQRGARLIVWNEAATAVLKNEENSFIKKLSSLARTQNIELVSAYIVPLSLKPLRYENKYRWFRPDGTLHHTYFKHEPVAGEPCTKGTAPMRTIQSKIGRLSGAICYDYDYPWIGKAHAAIDTDIVALPSSDWRGIDPLHSQMAAVRAIENGFSIVRSTRFGLSAGIDCYGRFHTRMSHFNSKEKIMLSQVPNKKITTLYNIVGDTFILICILLIVGILSYGFFRQRG